MHDFGFRSLLYLPQFLLPSLFLPLSSLADSQPPAVTLPAVLPKLVGRQDTSGTTSCDAFFSIISSCSQQLSSAAQCYCYSGTSFAPDAYDSALDTCLSYLETANPVVYSSFTADGLGTAPCQALGPLATTGSAANADPNKTACASWLAIRTSCEAAAPSDFLPATNPVSSLSSEASCLCYTTRANTLIWAPAVYDGYWSSCIEYYKTANPAFYSATLVVSAPASGFESPCSQIGNVRSATASITGASIPGAGSAATTEITGALTTTIAPTGAKTGGAGRLSNDLVLVGIGLGISIIASWM